MNISGGCYCGKVKYEVAGEPRVKTQCHFRGSKYFSGGHPNVVLGISNSDFKYFKGAPNTYSRKDLDTPRTRDFYSNCGIHLLTRSPSLPDDVLLK